VLRLLLLPVRIVYWFRLHMSRVLGATFSFSDLDAMTGESWLCKHGVHAYRYFWSSNRYLASTGKNYMISRCIKCNEDGPNSSIMGWIVSVAWAFLMGLTAPIWAPMLAVYLIIKVKRCLAAERDRMDPTKCRKCRNHFSAGEYPYVSWGRRVCKVCFDKEWKN